MADLRDELRVVQVELAATQEENLAGYQMHEEVICLHSSAEFI